MIKNLNLPYDEGDMGPMYGFQLRHFNANYDDMNGNYNNKGIDQLEYCLNLLKNDCYNRRILMTTFNPIQVNKGVLYPCHGIVIQFFTSLNKLNLKAAQPVFMVSAPSIYLPQFSIVREVASDKSTASGKEMSKGASK